MRDRLWVWSHPAGSFNTAKSKSDWPFSDYGFAKTSRMTPAEGASYLNVPNVIFLRYVGRPLPGEFERYARMLRPFKRVVWSINLTARRDGAARFTWSSTDQEEHAVIRDLLKHYPNLIGLVMDDYFRTPGEKHFASGPGEVQTFKKTFGRPSTPLGVVPSTSSGPEPAEGSSSNHAEFWDAIYTADLENTSKEHLSVVDVMTLWTREGKDLVHLEENFEKSCRLSPQTRKVLGCYLWDYLGARRPIPMALIMQQCALGLRWLKEKRIEGICFLATPMFDMGVEAVEWTRQWIQKVGDQRLST